MKEVLSCFGKTIGPARRSYRAFVSRGIEEGRRWDLTGGGLIRSTGRWAAVRALKKENVHLKSDERILGDGDFVAEILEKSQERFESRHALQAQSVDVDHLAQRVAELLWNKNQASVAAR